jgi:hypothetical protein
MGKYSWIILVLLILFYSFILNKERVESKRSLINNTQLVDSLVNELDSLKEVNCKYQEKLTKAKFFWEVISKTESGNNNTLVGDNGKALGSYQIHNIAVLDINRLYATEFTHQQMLDDSIAIKFGTMYLNKGAELYYKKHGVYPSLETFVNFWNFGIYQQQYDNGYYTKFNKHYKIT